MSEDLNQQGRFGRVAPIDKIKFLRKREEVGFAEIPVWDSVSRCHEGCPIYADCPYREERNPEKCIVEWLFIRHIIRMTINLKRDEKIDGMSCHLVGMTVIPLYQHYIKFKILELSLEQVMVGNSSQPSTYKVHPVYKATQDTLVRIQQAWEKLKIQTPELPDPSDLLEPGQDYYELMADEDNGVATYTTPKERKEHVNVPTNAGVQLIEPKAGQGVRRKRKRR